MTPDHTPDLALEAEIRARQRASEEVNKFLREVQEARQTYKAEEIKATVLWLLLKNDKRTTTLVRALGELRLIDLVHQVIQGEEVLVEL